MRGMKFKQCPFCRFWVEKTEGCDHMRCRCGKEFCYKCGGIYGHCRCMAANYVYVPPPPRKKAQKQRKIRSKRKNH